MSKLVVLGVAGSIGALTAAAVRKLQGSRVEQDMWREVTDPV